MVMGMVKETVNPKGDLTKIIIMVKRNGNGKSPKIRIGKDKSNASSVGGGDILPGNAPPV
jgi:hypothetical protein